MDPVSFKDIMLLVAGAAVGVLGERTLGRPWDRHVTDRVRRVFSHRRAKKRRLRLSVSGEFLSVGGAGERVFVHQFSPLGFDRAHLHTGLVPSGDLANQVGRLPELLQPLPVSEVDDRVRAERQRIAGDPTAWNEEKFGPSAIQISRDPQYDEPHIQISFQKTDHATFLAIGQAWQELVRKQGLDSLASADRLRQVLPGLSHSFGINATVVTADGRLLLTKRNGAISGNRPFKHISVNEGMRVADLFAGRPDPYATLRRGIEEELGITIPPDVGVFHSLILDVNRYQWGLLGHVDLTQTKWDSAQVRAARATGRSIDNWETDEVRDVPFTLDSVIKELADKENWIAHGWVNLLLTAFYKFPSNYEKLLDVLATVSAATRRSSKYVEPPR